MDITRSAWIAPARLDRALIELVWEPSGHVALSATGYCLTKRKPLWIDRRLWEPTQDALVASEDVCHLVHTLLLDRPRSAELLQLSLGGTSLWEDQTLPW